MDNHAVLLLYANIFDVAILSQAFGFIQLALLNDWILLKVIYCNQSIYIQYEEFVRAAVDKTSFLQESSLRFAFRYFDKDNSGEITYDEIQAVFEESINDKNKVKEALSKIISEVDANGDGIISFEEFASIMKKLLLRN